MSFSSLTDNLMQFLAHVTRTYTEYGIIIELNITNCYEFIMRRGIQFNHRCAELYPKLHDTTAATFDNV